MEKSNAKESQKCAGCLNNIGEEDYVSALGQDWHKDCFRCSVCDAALSSWYFEKNGLLFCQPHYWERYGECCQQCTQVITGPVMLAGAHRFHPECFACAQCGAPIEDAEPYALVERTRLYCGGCYCSGGGSHSIRVVSVPSCALRVEPAPANTLTVTDSACGAKVSCVARGLLRAALSLCIQLTCHRYDSSCGVVTLHIGDRILEINGAPPRASALAVTPPTLLQLTIEHNPDTTRNRKIMCNILPDKQANTEIKIPEEKDQKTSTEYNNVQKTSTEYNNDQKTSTEYNNVQKTSTEYNNDQKTSTEYNKVQKTSTDQNIPIDQSTTGQKTEELEKDGRRERLFKRKGEDGGKTRVIKRRQTPSSPLLGEKERSSSMSKLLDVSDSYTSDSNDDVLCELSRARSFRAQPEPQQKVFRACDLIQGELLGSGFFGEVYKVTHRASGDIMVLKQLYRVDDDAQKNFLKEVAVLRSLSHPNVLRFVGVVYKDKRLHLVTEYVAGGTLHQLIQDSSVSLSWSERARLARDVSAGVGYLHRRNVIHRDLNSHNCLVREDKTVIVADFGLARIVQRTASSTLQRGAQHNTLRRKRYTVVGNPYWMAPEMMNGKVYDEKVDVFSFGVILCEIIGRVSADPDFLPRRSDFGLNEALFIEKFCRPRACPEPFYRVAFRACQLDPDKRPPFEVIEIWLESLVMDLSRAGPPPPTLLADILSYAHSPHSGPTTPDCHDTCHCQNSCQSQNNCQNSIQERIPCQRNGENKTCCQQEKCCHCENTYSHQEQCCVHAYSESYKSECDRSGGYCGGGGVCRCRVRRVPSNAGSEDLVPDAGLVKSKSNAVIIPAASAGRALGKCVSASHICARPVVTVTSLSRSQNALANPGFILRAVGKSINITKVDDITEWLDSPPPLKRTSPDAQLNKLPEHAAREADDSHLPAFLRNQSVEGLESKYKQELDTASLSRHGSVHPATSGDDTDSSDDELICNWYKNVSNSKKMDVDKNVITNIIKKGENLLKKTSYDVADVMLRNPECCNERKFPEEDQRRFNIDYMKRTPIMAEGLKHIPRAVEVQKEKTNFFSKKLLSPKLSRLFKANTTEVVRNKAENDNKMINKSDDSKEEKSRSKFFIQRPISPNITRSSYRVRPVDETERKHNQDVLKSDIKLASMGKPMTPTFRRHLPNERPDFVDSRFSYRVSKPKFEPKTEPKFVDVGRNRIKAPLPIEKRIRTAQNQTKPKESSDDKPKRREGISRSNYVSLANLKINSKGLDDKMEKRGVPPLSPLERAI